LLLNAKFQHVADLNSRTFENCQVPYLISSLEFFFTD